MKLSVTQEEVLFSLAKIGEYEINPDDYVKSIRYTFERAELDLIKVRAAYKLPPVKVSIWAGRGIILDRFVALWSEWEDISIRDVREVAPSEWGLPHSFAPALLQQIQKWREDWLPNSCLCFEQDHNVACMTCGRLQCTHDQYGCKVFVELVQEEKLVYKWTHSNDSPNTDRGWNHEPTPLRAGFGSETRCMICNEVLEPVADEAEAQGTIEGRLSK